ncbi:MAG: glycosyltransferase family 87 protein [Anaerolineae bacterium]
MPISIKQIISAFVLVGVFVVTVIATHNFLTQPFPGHNDFLSRWEGARSFWVDGLNPYGEQASLNIQTEMYGRPALPDEDQVLFAYPMYTAILIAPLVYVDYAWASALMMVIMEALLIVALLLLLDLYRWRPTLLQQVMLLLIVLFAYPFARGLILGQLGVIAYVMYAVTLWALHRERPVLAGVALSIATIKPQLGFLIVPFLLLWGAKVRHTRFVGSFALSWGGLMAFSFALVPGWLGDMWDQVRNYTGYAPPSAWQVLLGRLGIAENWQYVIFALMWIALLAVWYQVFIQNKLERAYWAGMLTLAVSNLASPALASPHFTVFFIVLIFYLKQLAVRGQRGWLWALLLIVLIEPWVRFILTLDYGEKLESAWMIFPEPVLVLISLWLTRQLWWRSDLLAPPTKRTL